MLLQNPKETYSMLDQDLAILEAAYTQSSQQGEKAQLEQYYHAIQNTYKDLQAICELYEAMNSSFSLEENASIEDMWKAIEGFGKSLEKIEGPSYFKEFRESMNRGFVGPMKSALTYLHTAQVGMDTGAGTLMVVPSVLNVKETLVPLVPEDTWVRNPKTGLWHKLEVTVEDGVLVPEFSNVGVSR